jgi:hypothetical protein
VKSPSSASSRQHSPLPLRVLHGLVFAGFTTITLVAAWPEVQHLVRSQLQPFNPGTPPRPALVLAALMALVGMSVVLVQAVRARSAHLTWSALILGALVLATWGNQEGPAVGRTADAVNLKVLRVTRELHGRTVNELQRHGFIPEDVDSWRQALAHVAQGQTTAIHTRSFQPLPFLVQRVASPDALPSDAPPGTLLVYVLEGGAAYEIHPVGISPSGEAERLKEPGGDFLVFRGAFNPDLPPPADEGSHGSH